MSSAWRRSGLQCLAHRRSAHIRPREQCRERRASSPGCSRRIAARRNSSIASVSSLSAGITPPASPHASGESLLVDAGHCDQSTGQRLGVAALEHSARRSQLRSGRPPSRILGHVLAVIGRAIGTATGEPRRASALPDCLVLLCLRLFRSARDAGRDRSERRLSANAPDGADVALRVLLSDSQRAKFNA